MSIETAMEDRAFASPDELMSERGKFVANGTTFFVKPIYFEEVEDYLLEVRLPIAPDGKERVKEMLSDEEETGKWAMALFSSELNGKEKKEKSRRELIIDRIKKIVCTLIYRNDYRYYRDFPKTMPIVKWVEKKVSCNGKRIRFYDLERKYNLSKADIERLFIYLHDISGFSKHLI